MWVATNTDTQNDSPEFCPLQFHNHEGRKHTCACCRVADPWCPAPLPSLLFLLFVFWFLNARARSLYRGAEDRVKFCDRHFCGKAADRIKNFTHTSRAVENCGRAWPAVRYETLSQRWTTRTVSQVEAGFSRSRAAP